MKSPLTLSSFAAAMLAAVLCISSQAQMGTPAPPGPPSAQPAPKAPSQPSTGESVKDAGGPQITVPLKRPEPAPLVRPSSSTAPSPGVAKPEAITPCKDLPTRQARRDCRKRAKE